MSTHRPSLRPSCATCAPPIPAPKHSHVPAPPLPHLPLNRSRIPPPWEAPCPVIFSITLKNQNLTHKNRFKTNSKRTLPFASAGGKKTKKTQNVTPDSTPPPKRCSFPCKTPFVPSRTEFVPAVGRAPQRLRHRLASRKSPPRPRLPNPLAWPALRHQHPPPAKLHPCLPPVRQRRPVRPPARTGTRHHPLGRTQSQPQPHPLQLPPRRSRHKPHPDRHGSIRSPPQPHPRRGDPRIQEPSPCPDHHPGLSRILPPQPQV